MSHIRQLTQKGDPMARIQLPEAVVTMLKASAKKNKRRTQDQFIKSIAETFKNEAAFASLSEKFMPDLREVYQAATTTN